MAAKMIIEIPKVIQNRIDILTHENFFLWMFISSQDLRDEAREYIDDATQRPLALDHWLDSALVYADRESASSFEDAF